MSNLVIVVFAVVSALAGASLVALHKRVEALEEKIG